MRILLINDYADASGGAEISQNVLREALERRGHEVRLFASRARRGGAPKMAADYTCFGTTSRFRTLLQACNPWAFAGLRRALRDFRPDVVHVRIFLTQLSPLILPLLRRFPSLHHMTWHRSVCPVGTKILPGGEPCREHAGWPCCRHGCVPRRDWLPILLQVKLWRAWSGAFRLMLANSEEGRQLLEAEGFPNLHVISNGVREVAERPPLAAPPVVLFAGRLVSQKGVDILMRAFASVVKQVPEAQLWIAGDGPERDSLAELAGQLNLRESVRWLGQLDRDSLEQCGRAAWVQVAPSRHGEAFGNTAAEGMMRGTAVVASRTGAMATYIRHGETGMLAPPGDEPHLAAALLLLLRDRETAERLGHNGRQAALRELTADIWAERLEALYRKALG